MATIPNDLKTVYDHPAVILEDFDEFAVPTDGPRACAGLLRKWEAKHGVTFAALDNDALRDVREAYSRKTDAYGIGAEESHAYLESCRLADLESAINDLLGLDD